MKRYGLWGNSTHDFLTYGGKILVHGDRGELEYLFPGAPVREVPPSIPPASCMPVEFHPDLATVSWPLTRDQFRHAG